jgi:signal peptidase I
MMQQETEYKRRLLPALVKLGFNNWEDIFGSRKDDILVHRVDSDTMSPWIPRGSIVLVDTTKHWPVTNELYLVQYHPIIAPQLKRIHWIKPTAGKPYKLELKDEYVSIGHRYQRENYGLKPEEWETREIDWIKGRVIGVVAMFEAI